MLQASFLAEAPPVGWALGCIDSLQGIDRMREEWQALERRAADSLSYFQSYDWCRTWCAYYAKGADRAGPQIRIYTCRLGGRLVMVWPMMLVGGRRPLKTIVALAEPHGQYGNMLIDPIVWSAGLAADLVESCWRLVDSRERADAIMLDCVPDGALPRRLYASGEVKAEPAGLNSAMDLTRFDGCYEAYRADLKNTTRRARNKRRNRLAAQGALDYRVHFGGTPEYAELVRIGIAMKREWLEHTGRATRALNLPEVPEFLGALPNSAEGDNGAVAAALTLDGRPVAVEIGFRYHRRFYSYLGAFDWELRDFSPGKLQLEEALRWCLANGIEVYDLLSDPSAYKSDWCNVTTPLTTYRRASTLTGKAYLGLWCDNLRPALKRAFEQLPLGVRSRLIPMAENRTHTAQALSWK